MKKVMRQLSALLLALLILLPGTEALASLRPCGAMAAPAAQEQLTADGRSGSAISLKKKKKKKKNSSGGNTQSSTGDDRSSGEESRSTEKQTDGSAEKASAVTVEEDGEYTSKEEVAAYLHAYGHLPSNFITKNEAKKLGWSSSAGNLDEVAPGKSIGGDYFGNYEGQLPEKKGREYHECDIDYTGGYRDAKRIIYSNDGLIYYTEDHYSTFEQLYPQD